MNTVHLTDYQLLYTVETKGRLYPYFGINAPNTTNLYITYFVTGEHLSIHANHKPMIKHLRGGMLKHLRGGKNDLYEIEVEDWSGDNFYEPLGISGVAVDWFSEQHMRPITEDQATLFAASNKRFLVRMMLDEYIAAGWTSGGLCVTGVVIPTAVKFTPDKLKTAREKYLPKFSDKEVILPYYCHNKCVLLHLYDAAMSPLSMKVGVCHKIDLQTSDPGPHQFFVKAFPKKGEKSLVELKGKWIKIKEP